MNRARFLWLCAFALAAVVLDLRETNSVLYSTIILSIVGVAIFVAAFLEWRKRS